MYKIRNKLDKLHKIRNQIRNKLDKFHKIRIQLLDSNKREFCLILVIN